MLARDAFFAPTRFGLALPPAEFVEFFLKRHR
jgi:hypothetical protein